MIWDFIQNQILGMKWLNALIGNLEEYRPDGEAQCKRLLWQFLHLWRGLFLRQWRGMTL